MIIQHDWEKIAQYVKKEKRMNCQNGILGISVLLEKAVVEMKK